MGQLPDFLQPYFWEVDFTRLCLPQREVYVVERILEYGEDEPPEMLVSFNWNEVKRFFEGEVRRLMQQL